MRICESFNPPEVNAAVSRRAARTGCAKTLTAAMLLAGAAGIGLAQNSDSDAAFLPSPVRIVSTTPTTGTAAGDQNPYGVAFVPNNFQTGSGPLVHGDVLVSNWNAKSNLQGTGTTIMRVPASGKASIFFQGNPGIGLSTALGALQYGFVVVGNAPTTDGTFATAKPGSLLVINNKGKLIHTIANAWIQAPWDMTIVDRGDLAWAFVSNALNGTVSRLALKVTSTSVTMTSAVTIASGYIHRGDPAAVFVAPTGLVYDARKDTLYVASTGDNEVFAVPNATTATTDNGPGSIVYLDDQHLHGALALAQAPNGHLLVTNSDVVNANAAQPSEIVEFTKDGYFVKQISVDTPEGSAFGLAVNREGDTAQFAAVDDATGSLIIWTLNLE